MRILLASAAAAAIAFAATPAFAQYGGSAQDQVDGAPNEAEPAPEGDNSYVDVPTYEDAGEVEMAGKLQDGEDYALADVDAGIDVDANVDAEVDVDVGQLAPPEAYDEGEPVEDDGAQPEGATWQGEDGRAYCRRSDGTTGLVVGGGAGALIGNGIDGGRRRGAGTIIGGIIGAVVGTAIERSANEQSCR